MQIEYVRIYVPQSGKEISVPKAYARNAGYPILDKPAVNRHGKPLREKVRVPLGTSATRKRNRKPAPAKADVPADQQPSSEANEEATK
jgi:hypothetical protein